MRGYRGSSAISIERDAVYLIAVDPLFDFILNHCAIDLKVLIPDRAQITEKGKLLLERSIEIFCKKTPCRPMSHLRMDKSCFSFDRSCGSYLKIIGNEFGKLLHGCRCPLDLVLEMGTFFHPFFQVGSIWSPMGPSTMSMRAMSSYH